VFYGSAQSRRQIMEVSERSSTRMIGAWLPCCGLIAQPSIQGGRQDYHVAADLNRTGQSPSATINADIVKQKMAENNGGYNAINSGKTHPKVLQRTDHRSSR